MSNSELIALAGFAVVAIAMLLITQTKERVSFPAWLIPAAIVVPFAAWTGLAIAEDGLFGLLPILMGSHWGLQAWFDGLMILTAAFFLLQNRAGGRHEIRGLATRRHLHRQHRAARDAGADGLLGA